MIFQKKIVSTRSKHRLWCLLFCLGSLLFVETAAADTQRATQQHKPRHSTPTRQQFKLNKTVFVTADFERRNTANDFAKWLRSQGVAASNAYNKAPNRITFVKAHSIEEAEGENAWQINIKSKRITVTFTTDIALQNTLNILQSMVTQDAAGTKYIPGGLIADWGRSRNSVMTPQETKTDMASNFQPISELEAILKRLGGKSKEIYLILISTDKWRMETPSLEAANLTNMLYPADGYYNVQQLQRIVQIAHKNHIEIIPTLELCSENRAFTNAFGHSIFSVEGMRLIRAAIEDCIKVLKPRKICLGTLSPQADMRYMKFISDLTAVLGVELVIIES